MSKWYSVEIFGRPTLFGQTDMTPSEVLAYFEARHPSEAIGAITLLPPEVAP